jgi:hypothetical protein
MVGVDETRGDQALAGIDGGGSSRRGAGADTGNQSVGDRDPTVGQFTTLVVDGRNASGMDDGEVGER